MKDPTLALDETSESADAQSTSSMGGRRANGPAPDTEATLHVS